jgi:hypothetical protein
MTKTGTKQTLCRQAISLNRANAPPTWLPASKPHNGSRPLARRQQGINIHATTCLNLNQSTDERSESDLWILPELDDWEEDADADTETETPILTPSSSAELHAPTSPAAATGRPAAENKWAGVLRRAANSNLERLRNRLEGEGWDFVKPVTTYHDHEDLHLDDEFDVVVLSGRGRE